MVQSAPLRAGACASPGADADGTTRLCGDRQGSQQTQAAAEAGDRTVMARTSRAGFRESEAIGRGSEHLAPEPVWTSAQAASAAVGEVHGVRPGLGRVV